MPAQSPLRLAMWSGPRNISTALMRSWGNRADTVVCDEPLYAHYLQATGRRHRGADEVIAAHECDCQKVVAWLTGPLPLGKAIFYQKQMAHHLLPEIDRGWLAELTNCFLIRQPSEMIASLVKHVPDARLPDTGLPQQLEMFRDEVERTGRVPPVLDSRDVLENPREMLGKLCAAVGVPFDEAMLAWPAGRRDTDGVWARYWYAEVEKTTSFAPYRPKNEPLPDALGELAESCAPIYDELYQQRLTV